MSHEPTGHIIQSLLVNLAIAAAKGVAAAFTGSGAMLAEAIHSSADCGNQLLLLLGVKRSQKAPDATHPLGYGRSLYFWSFMVAMLLFTGGGMFSIYEGLHKLAEPEPVEKVWLGLGILLFSLALEGYATVSNIRAFNQRRGQTPFLRYLRETKDSDLVVVFGENAAASLGLVLAALSLLLADLTGDPRFDAAGSLAVGLVLVAVAVFLAIEVMSLLVGESADPSVARSVHEVAKEHPRLERVLKVITIQQGPGEVLVAAKVRIARELKTDEVCQVINDFERALKARVPEVRWSFIEPDLSDEEPLPG